MAARTLGNLALSAFWTLGENGWKTLNDLNLLKLSNLAQATVISLVTALPGSPTNGDVHVLTDAAGSHPTEIAIRDEGAWVYVVPVEGWLVYSRADNAFYVFTGTVWTSLSSVFGKQTESIVIACSDEATALTTGTGKVTFRMPYAFTVTAVRASLSTPQTSGTTFTVDVNESGASILSTKLTIDNTESTSQTAATPAVISDATLADDAEITVDIDQIGDGTAKGLKVVLIGHQ